jgi:hypothetical protein
MILYLILAYFDPRLFVIRDVTARKYYLSEMVHGTQFDQARVGQRSSTVTGGVEAEDAASDAIIAIQLYVTSALSSPGRGRAAHWLLWRVRSLLSPLASWGG